MVWGLCWLLIMLMSVPALAQNLPGWQSDASNQGDQVRLTGSDIHFQRFSNKQQRYALVLKPAQADWRQFKQLQLRVKNPAQDSVYLGLRLQDASGQEAFWYEALAYNQSQTIIISLAQWVKEAEPGLDLSQIQTLELFLRHPSLFKADPHLPVVIQLEALSLTSLGLTLSEPKLQPTPGMPQRQLITSRSSFPADWTLEIFNASKSLTKQQFLNSAEPRWMVTFPTAGDYRVVVKAQKDEQTAQGEWKLNIPEALHRQALRLWTQPAALRPDPYFLPDMQPPDTAPAKLFLAPGETEGLLINLLADHAVTLHHQLQAIGLKARLWRVGYVQAWAPKQLYRLGQPGWIADALLPLNTDFELKPGQLEALYLEIQAPESAGQSEFALTLDWGSGQKLFNGSVQTLKQPETTPDWRQQLPLTAFSLYPEFFDSAYGSQASQRWAEAMDLLSRHNIYPGNIYQPPLTLNHLDAQLRLSGKRAWINLGYLGPDQLEDRLPALKAAYAEIKQRGRLDQAYIFAFDEYQGEAQALIKVAQTLQQELPGLPVVTTARLFGPDYRALKWPDNLHWCPSFRELELYQRFEGYQHTLQADWAYVFIAQRPPYPNWFLESNLIESRLIPWLAWQQNLKGLLYYTTNRWIGTGPEQLIQPVDFPLLSWKPNCFEDTNGDGCLLYPGAQGALPSLRLKNLQQGLEDWAMLRAVEAHCGREVLTPLTNGLIDSAREYRQDVKLLNSKAHDLRKLLEDCDALG